MGLNGFFSATRFYNVLKYDLILNKKKYIFFVVGLFLVLLIVDFWAVSNLGDLKRISEENELTFKYKRVFTIKDYKGVFFFSYVITAVLVVTTTFTEYNSKNSMSNYLMLPATVFEKFLSNFTIRIILFSIVFIVFFWLEFRTITSFVNIFEWRRPLEIPNFNINSPFIYNNERGIKDSIITIFSLFSFTSFLYAGAVQFKKSAFIETVLSLSVLLFIAYLFSAVMSYMLIPNHVESFEIDFLERKLDNGLVNVQFALYTIATFSSMFLLPYAYFKLKEKEL